MKEHPDRNNDTTGQNKRRIPRHLIGDALALVGGIIIVILIITAIIMTSSS